MDKKKKTYSAPRVAKVELSVEDAVLACCKTNTAVNAAARKNICENAKCLSSPTNLT